MDAQETIQMTKVAPPLITVVIPTRGRADLVVRSVRSALQQNYPAVEVVVVVDGPDPITVKRLAELGEQPLRVLVLSENVGGCEARNIGIREARGSWIAMLDDDDQWFPEKLAVQMAAIADTTARHNLVTCRRIEHQPGHPDVLAPRRLLHSGEDVSEYMFYPEDERHHICGPQTSSFLATKELFLAVPFTKGLKCHQDWDWYLRAMYHDGTTSIMVEDALYVMDVETTRSRMTQVARWQLSMQWIESQRHLFTPRAYQSFLINECMFRLEETRHRMRIFAKILSRCHSAGKLRNKDIAAIMKWYFFRPSVRMKIRRLQAQLRESLPGGTAARNSIGTAAAKWESHD